MELKRSDRTLNLLQVRLLTECRRVINEQVTDRQVYPESSVQPLGADSGPGQRNSPPRHSASLPSSAATDRLRSQADVMARSRAVLGATQQPKVETYVAVASLAC